MSTEYSAEGRQDMHITVDYKKSVGKVIPELYAAVKYTFQELTTAVLL
jgi:hypothetical protein